MTDTQRKELIADYLGGMAKFRIAKKYHIAKITINKILADATATGEIPPGVVQARSENYYRSEKKILETQVKYATACDLWKKGYTYEEIQKEAGMSFSTVAKYLKRAIENGDVFPNDSQERKMAVQARRRLKKDDKPEDRRVVYHKVESTLNPGETIRCTYKVSQSCVYGCRNAAEQRCRYSLITGKCRTIDKYGNKVNPLKACTCYSKVSKSNPKLNSAVEEGTACK